MEADQARELCEAANGAAGSSGSVAVGQGSACQQAQPDPERPLTAVGVERGPSVFIHGDLVLHLGVVGDMSNTAKLSSDHMMTFHMKVLHC